MCDLTQVLLRFRFHQYTYTCDIKQMYMNVQVNEEDQPYLRFFHRDQATQNILVYQSRGHLFGLNCSPFIAIETLKFMARKERAHPLVKDAVLNGSIVDDILVSLPDEKNISQIHEGILRLLGKLSMQIHKVGSNNEPFFREIPEAMRISSLSIEDKPLTPTIKTLGLIYKSDIDAFTFVFDLLRVLFSVIRHEFLTPSDFCPPLLSQQNCLSNWLGIIQRIGTHHCLRKSFRGGKNGLMIQKESVR